MQWVEKTNEIIIIAPCLVTFIHKQLRPATPPLSMTQTLDPALFDASSCHGALRLSSLGVIHAQGEDAASFLHGQLSQDTLLLPADQARLAAFCSAKGRILASFVVLKPAPDQLLLVCQQDLLAATLKRLKMFVLRAKVSLVDASTEFQLWGLAGAEPPGPALGAEPWALAASPDGAQAVRLYPALGLARTLWMAPLQVALPTTVSIAPEQWDWLEVHSGVAMVGQRTADAFVPQMLNHESVGGVNFKKGCYPGQEVVARSQFRGGLKRRAYVLHSDAPLAVGMEVFHESDAEQPCGTVVAAAANPVSGWDGVASMQIRATESGVLHAGSAAGPAMHLLPLPYPLLNDI